MTNTHNFAARELDILSKSSLDPNDRPLIEPFRKEILALCEKFGKSGQSGGSAPYTAGCISQAVKSLLLQEPICPITGIPDEWGDVAEEGGLPLLQNSRCSALFKNGSDGLPYYLDAIVWKSQLPHDTFTGEVSGFYSRQFIREFPFIPKTFYIDVIVTEIGDERHYRLRDPKQLNRVWKYYRKPLDIPVE